MKIRKANKKYEWIPDCACEKPATIFLSQLEGDYNTGDGYCNSCFNKLIKKYQKELHKLLVFADKYGI